VSKNGNLGYYARHTHDIIECDGCLLTDPSLDPIARFCSEQIKKNGWSVKHVYLRRGQMTSQTMLCLVTPDQSLNGEKEFALEAVRRFPEIKSVLLNIHPDETNVILGKKVKVLYGADRIEDILCGCRFGISSLSFYQVNRGGAELLYNEAIKRAEKISPKNVLDLYCGAGTIGLSYAKAHPETSVTGIEIIPEAVENAKENARLNGINNASFICADAMTFEIDDFDCVFIDPPRKGMSQELTEKIANSNLKKLVYVSCDPTTLARDAKKLIEAGYEMGEVTPVDMFPRTGHVESVVCFKKTN
jgi:23S rRNA (uracil1939-C5)-methyltransferase